MKITSITYQHQQIDFAYLGINNDAIQNRTQAKATILVKNDDEMKMLEKVEPIINLSSQILITNYFISEIWNDYSTSPFAGCLDQEVTIGISEIFQGDQIQLYFNEIAKLSDQELLTELEFARLSKILVENNQAPKHAKNVLKLMREIEENVED